MKENGSRQGKAVRRNHGAHILDAGRMWIE